MEQLTMEQKISRINELYHKSMGEGLTEVEKEEQKELRAAYIASVRANLRGQLNQITIEKEDGSRVNLGDRHGNHE